MSGNAVLDCHHRRSSTFCGSAISATARQADHTTSAPACTTTSSSSSYSSSASPAFSFQVGASTRQGVHDCHRHAPFHLHVLSFSRRCDIDRALAHVQACLCLTSPATSLHAMSLQSVHSQLPQNQVLLCSTCGSMCQRSHLGRVPADHSPALPTRHGSGGKPPAPATASPPSTPCATPQGHTDPRFPARQQGGLDRPAYRRAVGMHACIEQLSVHSHGQAPAGPSAASQAAWLMHSG